MFLPDKEIRLSDEVYYCFAVYQRCEPAALRFKLVKEDYGYPNIQIHNLTRVKAATRTEVSIIATVKPGYPGLPSPASN